MPPMPSPLYGFEPFSFFIKRVQYAWNQLLERDDFRYTTKGPMLDVDRSGRFDITCYNFGACFIAWELALNPLKLNNILTYRKNYKQLGDYLDQSYAYNSVEILSHISYGNWHYALRKYYYLIHRQNHISFTHQYDTHIESISRKIAKDERLFFPNLMEIRLNPSFITARLWMLSDLVYQYEYPVFQDYFDWKMSKAKEVVNVKLVSINSQSFLSRKKLTE